MVGKAKGLADQAAAYVQIGLPRLTGTVASLDKQWVLDRKELARAAAELLGAAGAFAVGVGWVGGNSFLPTVTGGLVKGLVGLTQGAKREMPIEGRLWQLVRQSLDLGWLTIARQALPDHDMTKLQEAVTTSLDAAIQHVEVTVDQGFLTQPASLPIVPLARTALEAWLRAMAVEPTTAEQAALLLPACFVASLRVLAAKEREAVSAIQALLVTPFDAADERQRARFAYRIRLEAELDLPLFDGPASLRQLYQPLRAYWTKSRELPDEEQLLRRPAGTARYRDERHVVEVEKALDAWLGTTEPNDGLRILSGGPGSGKSSFAKVWAAKIAKRDDLLVLLIPLQRLEHSGQTLADRLDAHAEKWLGLQEKPQRELRREGRLLLLLDGLDELVMQGKSGVEAADVLFGEVKQLLSNANDERSCLKILIGGREVLVDRLESQRLIDLAHVLHLLPYRVTEHERRYGGHEWQDPERLIDPENPRNDLRHAWWEAWGSASGTGLERVPEAIDSKPKLAELSEQPLLNFLLTLALQSGLDADSATGVNDVYAKLLEEVWRRRWGGARGQSDARLPDHQTLSLPQFERIFQAIALASWHSGGGRAVTTAAIRQVIEHEGLPAELRLVDDAAEKGALRLLTGFYFREAGRGSDESRAWEFTHKSFAEYLIARRLVRLMERIEKLRGAEAIKQELRRSETDTLLEWIAITGPTALDLDLLSMLRGEVARLYRAKVMPIQVVLTELMSWQLRHGMPMHCVQPPPASFKEATRRAANAEEALLAALNACARVTGKLIEVEWDDDRLGPRRLLTRLGPNGGRASGVCHECLDHLVLPRSDLFLVNLGGCSARKTDLSGANLAYTDLSGADLRGADLGGANLLRADLLRADLREARGLTRRQLAMVRNIQSAKLPDDLPEE